jgi:type IV pilus assembly protein PilW
MDHMNNYRQQLGLSLIELMIAMAISSFLILGVTQIYIDNKRSYSFQQNLAENQEGSRFALLLLQQQLSKSGYRRRPDESMESAFPAETIAGCAFVAGETVKSLAANSICIRYQPKDAADRDCLGNIPTTPTNFTAPYTKATQRFVERISVNANELTCTTASTTAALVSGVLDLRIEYGAGNAVAPQTISSYTTAPTSSQPILAIRYTLLARSSGTQSRDAVNVTTALAKWKTLTGATNAQETGISDLDKGQLYQLSQNTVMLRNRMP